MVAIQRYNNNRTFYYSQTGQTQMTIDDAHAPSTQTHQVYLLRLRHEPATDRWLISLQQPHETHQRAFADLTSLTHYLTEQMAAANTEPH